MIEVRLRKEETMKRILIATDGSPSAAHAVEIGLELAEEHGAEPIFVHVAPTMEVLPVGIVGMGAAPVSAPHVLDEHDRLSLDKAVQLAEEHGLETRTKLLIGDPAKQIVGYADSIDADLIVVGSHGHGTVSGALLGSVSRGVLRRTHRPVLVVREVPQLVEAIA
jgi:nucleotide-binding universal stress UspA family protein